MRGAQEERRCSSPASADLRQLLREKAASHRSFYRRLRGGSGAGGDAVQPTSPPAPAADPPSPVCLSLPPTMSGGGQLELPGRESPRSSAGSDEGCPGAADCSSDEEERRPSRPERPRSRDSAVDLDETPNVASLHDALARIAPDEREHAGYDSGGENAFDDSFEKRECCEDRCCYRVRSRMILEAQYVEYPFVETNYGFDEDAGETDVFSPDARRPSTLSWDGEEGGRVRKVRTPSVVVSDYSDDVHVGITSEELDYLRKRVESASNSSGRSSCSNSHCGSQLSMLDGSGSRCGSQLSVLDGDDSRRSSQLSVASLDEVKTEVSPLGSDGEDGDSGLGKQHKQKKITTSQ